MEKSFQRTCAICRAKKQKNKLFRFLIHGSIGSPQETRIVFDKNQKGEGRGFYICSKKCWDEGVKKKKKIKHSSRENRFITLPNISFEEIVKI